MPSDYDNDLLKEGLLHIRLKEYDLARPYLERALDNADDQDTRLEASYWLSVITADPQVKRRLLEDVLAIDMTNVQARRDLAILDGKLKPEAIVDPDAQPVPAPAAVETQAQRFTCPKCGGRMTYAPDGRSLVCENCQRSEQPSLAPAGAEQDFFIAMADGLGQRKPVSMVTFQCQGCGARFVLAPQELSATCAYCGSNHVVATAERRDLLEPDAIVPMAYDQKQATWHLVHWVEAHKIQPEGKVRPPAGLYLPVWTFDILGNIPWHGYRMRSRNERVSLGLGLSLTAEGLTGPQKEPVSGVYSVNYDHVCVTGMHKLADLLVQLLPGFDFRAAPSYDPRFLSGWPAEIYDISMADASLDARKIAVDQIRVGIKSELDHVQEASYSTSSIAVTGFKLVLVPAWLTEYTFEDHPYQVIINGQTGAVYGQTPARGLSGWVDTLLGNR